MEVSTIGVLCPSGYRKSNGRLGVYLAWHAQQHRKQAMMYCKPIFPASEVQGHPLIHSKFEESLRHVRPSLITKQKQKLKSHIKAHILIMEDLETSTPHCHCWTGLPDRNLIKELTNVMTQMNLKDIYRTF